MAGEFRCGTRMDGSGAGTASSSPNRPLRPEILVLSAHPTAPHAVSTSAETFEPCLGEAPRGALPAGHPLSWGPLTAGTVLDGAPYAHIP
jgi:hypothetical protein